MKISFAHIVVTVLIWILAFIVVEIFRLVIWERVITDEKEEFNCRQ